MKIRSTWYRATTKDGSTYTVACCPDYGTVSLRWNEGFVNDLIDWTEKGLKTLIESKTNEQVTSLVAC